MAAFSEQEITRRLSDVPGWAYEGGQLTRTFAFGSFMAGIDFVGKVAAAAEAADHHPDIDIRYSTITISMSSHDAGGITDRDFGLASTVSGLA